MSEKYGNPFATYNIPLNSSEIDVFRTGCDHLYNFLHISGKSADYKPMMLKMHLEFHRSLLAGEAEEKNIGDSNSNYAVREYVQQLEAKINTLEDVLRQVRDDANKLIERLGKLEKDNVLYKAADDGNNTFQDCSKQLNDENKSSGEYSGTESDSSSIGPPTRPEENLKFSDAGPNCVHIQNFKCSDSSFFVAFMNIHKLAPIPDNCITSIRVVERSDNYLDYMVYFLDEAMKKAFLTLVQ